MEPKTNDLLLSEIMDQIEKMDEAKLEYLAAFIAGLKPAQEKNDGQKRQH